MSTLSNPVVEINDEVIHIKGNSLSFRKGKGEKRVRTQSAGGNQISVVTTTDAETKMSVVKFTMLTTNENIALYDSWDAAGENGNVIRLSEKDGSLALAFRQMTLISDNEIGTGAEGEFEIEFNGPPIV